MVPLTWLYTVQHVVWEAFPIPLTTLTTCTYHSISLYLHYIQHALYLHTVLTPCHSCVLMHTSVLKICYPHSVPFLCKTPPFFYHLSFSHGTPKASVIPALVLSPIHPFRSPWMHNLYPFPTLSRVLSMLFQNLFFFLHLLLYIGHTPPPHPFNLAKPLQNTLIISSFTLTGQIPSHIWLNVTSGSLRD